MWSCYHAEGCDRLGKRGDGNLTDLTNESDKSFSRRGFKPMHQHIGEADQLERSQQTPHRPCAKGTPALCQVKEGNASPLLGSGSSPWSTGSSAAPPVQEGQRHIGASPGKSSEGDWRARSISQTRSCESWDCLDQWRKRMKFASKYKHPRKEEWGKWRQALLSDAHWKDDRQRVEVEIQEVSLKWNEKKY